MREEEFPEFGLLMSLEDPPLELNLLLQLLSPLRLLLNVLRGGSAKEDGRHALDGID